jgi:hypothetical protein
MAVAPLQLPNNFPDYSTRRAILSRSLFSNRASLDKIYEILKALKVTGQLTVNIHGGGKNTVVFTEEQDVNGATEIHVVPPDEKKSLTSL